MRRSTGKIAGLLLIALAMTTSSAFGSGRLMPRTDQQGTTESAKTGGQKTTTPSSRPNPDASGVYHAGPGVSAPQAIYTVDPEFSDKARKKKLGGTSVIGMIVDPSGTPRDVHVVQSLAEGVAPKLRTTAQSLDVKAVEAVKQYKFKPATYEGKAVPYELKVEINFRIY